MNINVCLPTSYFHLVYEHPYMIVVYAHFLNYIRREQKGLKTLRIYCDEESLAVRFVTIALRKVR